jgi:hypothetical protein
MTQGQSSEGMPWWHKICRNPEQRAQDGFIADLKMELSGDILGW